jgi:hypothetical protein
MEDEAVTEPIVNTAECVEIVRALVAAFEEKGHPLTRVLNDEYRPESHLLPWRVDVSTELVERGLKALGLPAPDVPKPKKIPTRPTEAQARVLDYLNTHEDARLKAWRGWGYNDNYHVMRPGFDSHNDETKLTQSTFYKLRDYRWIVFEREIISRESYYKLTDAGREALTRYQVKIGVVA